VRRKAQSLKVSKSRVLEWMRMEFSPSTANEKRIQMNRKYEAEVKYLIEHINRTFDEIKDAWRAGYFKGWHDFQIRKSTHPFRLEE